MKNARTQEHWRAPKVSFALMKQRAFLLTLALGLAAPLCAQTAPAGWQTQTREGGARTFTPPDLPTGEIYSVTVYGAAPLGNKSLENYLRQFAGTVGDKAGQLAAPLQIKTEQGVVSGIGVYLGPDGSQLNALFIGATSDGGKTVRLSRTLFSSETLLTRFQNENSEIAKDLIVASKEPGATKQPRRPVSDEPQEVADIMKVGGPLKPGVYNGTQSNRGLYGSRSQKPLRVYIYANGEYRITDHHDEDFDINGPVVGKFKYNEKRGLLNLGTLFNLENDNRTPERYFCYYGVDDEGTPTILARGGILPTTQTYLTWSGPPTGRLSPSAQNAPAAARPRALDAIQTIVAPGQGVKSAQIAAIVHDFSDTVFTMPGVYVGEAMGGTSPSITTRNITDEVYLLLRDGTAYRGLQIAPDQFDAPASRRKEPGNWGLWKTENGKTQISLGGQPYETLDGKKVSPLASGTRFGGRYVFYDSDIKGAISFTAAGRFTRNTPTQGGVTLAQANKTVAGGDLKGAYEINGYAMTLRYDNGKVTRTPFFWGDQTRDTIWFEGHQMFLDR